MDTANVLAIDCNYVQEYSNPKLAICNDTLLLFYLKQNPVSDKPRDVYKRQDVDISNAIADYLNMKIDVEDMEFDSIITAVSSGKADFGIDVYKRQLFHQPR